MNLNSAIFPDPDLIVCLIVSSIFGHAAPQGPRRLLVASSIHHNPSANHKAASFHHNFYNFLKTFARLAGEDHSFLQVCPWRGSCGSQTQSVKWRKGNRRVFIGWWCQSRKDYYVEELYTIKRLTKMGLGHPMVCSQVHVFGVPYFVIGFL